MKADNSSRNSVYKLWTAVCSPARFNKNAEGFHPPLTNGPQEERKSRWVSVTTSWLQNRCPAPTRLQALGDGAFRTRISVADELAQLPNGLDLRTWDKSSKLPGQPCEALIVNCSRNNIIESEGMTPPAQSSINHFLTMRWQGVWQQEVIKETIAWMKGLKPSDFPGILHHKFGVTSTKLRHLQAEPFRQ